LIDCLHFTEPPAVIDAGLASPRKIGIHDFNFNITANPHCSEAHYSEAAV